MKSLLLISFLAASLRATTLDISYSGVRADGPPVNQILWTATGTGSMMFGTGPTVTAGNLQSFDLAVTFTDYENIYPGPIPFTVDYTLSDVTSLSLIVGNDGIPTSGSMSLTATVPDLTEDNFFVSSAFPGLPPNSGFFGGTQNDIEGFMTFTNTPEPAAVGLFGGGLFWVGLLAQRSSNRSKLRQ